MLAYLKKVYSIIYVVVLRLLSQFEFRSIPTISLTAKVINDGKLCMGKGINIKPNSVLYIKGNAKLTIGNRFSTGHHTEITCGLNITIGDNVIMAPYTYISDQNHGISADKCILDQPMQCKKVVIGNDVWIGRGAQILSGVWIPNGTVVAAGAIVTKQFHDEYTIIAGVPAKVIGFRHRKMV